MASCKHFLKHTFLIYGILVFTLVGCSPRSQESSLTATLCPPGTVTQTPPLQPTLEVETLLLGNSLFIQQDTNLTTVFMVDNTDAKLTYFNVEYKVLAYDAAGATIGFDRGVIDFIHPGDSFGVVSLVELVQYITVDKVDVEWTYSYESNSKFISPFKAETPHYFKESNLDIITALISNESNVSYTDLRVNAIALDNEGRLIGGGIGNVDILPGKDQVGVTIIGTLVNTPASVLLFPTKGIHSAGYEDGNWRNNLEIKQYGFVQDDIQVGGGFILTNITDHAIKDSRYTVTVYEADGSVSNVTSGFIDLLWPGETQGVSPGIIPLFSGASPARVDVAILSGVFTEVPVENQPLRVEQVSFSEDIFMSRVSAEISNTYNRALNDIVVYVLLFDEKDEIIGGGYGQVASLAANADQVVEIPVTYILDVPPSRVEAYPALSNSTQPFE